MAKAGTKTHACGHKWIGQNALIIAWLKNLPILGHYTMSQQCQVQIPELSKIILAPPIIL